MGMGLTESDMILRRYNVLGEWTLERVQFSWKWGFDSLERLLRLLSRMALPHPPAKACLHSLLSMTMNYDFSYYIQLLSEKLRKFIEEDVDSLSSPQVKGYQAIQWHLPQQFPPKSFCCIYIIEAGEEN